MLSSPAWRLFFFPQQGQKRKAGNSLPNFVSDVLWEVLGALNSMEAAAIEVLDKLPEERQAIEAILDRVEDDDLPPWD